MRDLSDNIVDSGRLEEMQALDADLGSLMQGCTFEVDQAPRLVIMSWLRTATGKMKLQQDSLMRAVQLFDIACAKRSPSTAELPKLVCAVASVTYKMNGVSDDEPIGKQLRVMASQLAQVLGHVQAPDQFKGAKLFSEEMALLKLLDWNLQRPTVRDWLELFSDRLTACCGQALGELHPNDKYMSAWLGLIVTICPLCERRGGAHWAGGLLCARLASLGLVRMEDLIPDQVVLGQWQEVSRYPLFQAKPNNETTDFDASPGCLARAFGVPPSQLMFGLRLTVSTFWWLTQQDEHQLKGWLWQGL